MSIKSFITDPWSEIPYHFTVFLENLFFSYGILPQT